MALSGDAAAASNAAAEDGNCTRISCMAPPQLSASQYIKLRKSSEAGLFVVATCGARRSWRAARCGVFGEEAALVQGTLFAPFSGVPGCAIGGCADSILKSEASSFR